MWGNTLYHLDDLPFPPARIPDVYSQFRNAVEKRSQVRPEMPPPREWRAIPEKLADEAELRKLGLRTSLPSPAELGAEAGPGTDARSTHPFPGGESAALQRLREYFWDRDCLKDYKETRNGLLGADYSSKFSPWLAFGCVAHPRLPPRSSHLPDVALVAQLPLSPPRARGGAPLREGARRQQEHILAPVRAHLARLLPLLRHQVGQHHVPPQGAQA